MNIEEMPYTGQDRAALAVPPPAARAGLTLRRLLSTSDAVWPLVLRVTLGGVMLPHALQKTLGLFGGGGFSNTMHWFTALLRLPAALALLVVFIEQACSIGLVLGLFTRASAAGMGALMIGAIFTVHLQNGFFMNWSGTQAGEGYEFHLLVIAMVVALLIGGGGRASIDRSLSRARRS